MNKSRLEDEEVVEAAAGCGVAVHVKVHHMPFADIARECGQLSPSHLAEIFRRRFGVTMSEYRRNNR